MIKYQNKYPQIDATVFVAAGVQLIGDVVIDAHASIWFNSVLRGDVHFIRVGKRTNIQDLTVVHVASGKYPTLIGDDVTVGHRALIHACTIGDRCLIGMGAIVMDGAQIGNDCIVAAGSLVLEKTVVPEGSLVMGTPAKVVRSLRDAERQWILQSSKNYCELAKNYHA